MRSVSHCHGGETSSSACREREHAHRFHRLLDRLQFMEWEVGSTDGAASDLADDTIPAKPRSIHVLPHGPARRVLLHSLDSASNQRIRPSLFSRRRRQSVDVLVGVTDRTSSRGGALISTGARDHVRKTGRPPRVEPAGKVGDVPKAGAPQQAGGDRTAVAPFAVHH